MRTNILTARVSKALIGNPITLERLIEKNKIVKPKIVMQTAADKLAAECDKYIVVDDLIGKCIKLSEDNYIFNKNRIAATKQLQVIKPKLVNKLTDACQKVADGYSLHHECYDANADRIWASETGITRLKILGQEPNKWKTVISEFSGAIASEQYRETCRRAAINASNYECDKISAAEIKCQMRIFAKDPKSKAIKESIKASNLSTEKIPMIIRSRNNPTAPLDIPTVEIKNKRMLIGLAERYSNIVHVSSEEESNTLAKTLRHKNKLRNQIDKMDKKRIINNCLKLSDEYATETAKPLTKLNSEVSGMLSTIPLWLLDMGKVSQRQLIKQLKKSTSSSMQDGEFVAKALKIAELERTKKSLFDRVIDKLFKKN